MFVFRSNGFAEHKEPAPGGRIVKPVFDKNDIEGARLSVVILRLEQGKQVLDHIHDGGIESMYVLEGVCTFTVAGESADLGVGDALYVPENTVHSAINKHPEPVRVLCMFAPATDCSVMRTWEKV